MSVCTCTPKQKASGKPSPVCEAHMGFRFGRRPEGVSERAFVVEMARSERTHAPSRSRRWEFPG